MAYGNKPSVLATALASVALLATACAQQSPQAPAAAATDLKSVV